MTPQEAIDGLDRAIAVAGQTVTLRRVVPNAPAIEKQVRAFVRGYKPEELTGGITMGASEVVISPTDLAGSVFATSYPQVGDKVTVAGRSRQVTGAEPVMMDDVLVRVNLVVTG